LISVGTHIFKHKNHGLSLFQGQSFFSFFTRFLPLLGIPLFFLILGLGQAGLGRWLPLLMFAPLLVALMDARIPILLNLAVVFLFGAIYIATNFSWLSRFYQWAVPLASTIGALLHFVLPATLVIIIFRVRGGNCLSLLMAASAWTINEYVMALFPFPFPYCSVAFSLFMNNRLLQILDIVGQYGLAFLIFFSGGLFLLFAKSLSACFWKQSLRFGVVLGLLLAGWLGYGYLTPYLLKNDRILYVDMVQTSLLSRDKVGLTPEKYREKVERLIDLRNKKADLIIFPETFIYSDVSHPDDYNGQWLMQKSRDEKINMVGGFIEKRDEGPCYLANSVFLITSDGQFSSDQKIFLAPFGEYYPLGILFPEFKKLLREKKGSLYFNRGERKRVMEYSTRNGAPVRIITLICYESAYSYLLNGTGPASCDLIVNISSDLWTGSSQALMQNALFAKYRAIEFRIPVVRVSNGGLSGYISPLGKAWLPIPAFMEGTAHIRMSTLRHKIYKNRTPFSLFGNWIIPVGFSLLFFFFLEQIIFVPRRKRTIS
jgi:apolipoprotein N-acyltransferase